MTEEIINSDGSRNWQANILLDNVKRLEQENKELKSQIESQKGLITVGGKQQYEYLQRIDELEQANRELKAYKAVNEDFKKAWDELNEKYKQLRSALEEIKNDLKEVCKEECDYTKPKFCGDCDCRYGQILNKINEVLQ